MKIDMLDLRRTLESRRGGGGGGGGEEGVPEPYLGIGVPLEVWNPDPV